MTSADVDAYISKSKKWRDEMAELRPILIDCGLDETIKWHKPCFFHEAGNIAIFQEMKQHLALLFFKGALLDDPNGVLTDQGPNSRSARRIEFHSVDEVKTLTDTVKQLVAHAVDVERSGSQVGPPPELRPVEELQRRLDSDPIFKQAFDSLTPGRQREYNMHISGAKQAATRLARLEKFAPKILVGKGMRDH